MTKADVPDFIASPRLARAEGSVFCTKAPVAAKPKGKGATKARRKAKAATLAGHDGKFEVGTRIVDDPDGPGAKVRARVNLAEHPLELMRAKGRMAEAHYVAGVKFRAIYERAAIGAANGIDLTKIKVDGGGAGDPLDGGVAEAHIELLRLYRWLGKDGGRIVEMVCGRGMSIAELALIWPCEDNELMRRNYLTLRLREALEVLACEVWGATGPARGRMEGWQQGGARAEWAMPGPVMAGEKGR